MDQKRSASIVFLIFLIPVLCFLLAEVALAGQPAARPIASLTTPAYQITTAGSVRPEVYLTPTPVPTLTPAPSEEITAVQGTPPAQSGASHLGMLAATPEEKSGSDTRPHSGSAGQTVASGEMEYIQMCARWIIGLLWLSVLSVPMLIACLGNLALMKRLTEESHHTIQ